MEDLRFWGLGFRVWVECLGEGVGTRALRNSGLRGWQWKEYRGFRVKGFGDWVWVFLKPQIPNPKPFSTCRLWGSSRRFERGFHAGFRVWGLRASVGLRVQGGVGFRDPKPSTLNPKP